MANNSTRKANFFIEASNGSAVDADEEDRPELIPRRRFTQTPPKRHRLGWLDIILLHLNRTIGSGVFVSTTYVLRGTGSVGATMCLWAAGGIVSWCSLSVWLELGLTLPRFKHNNEWKSLPRSGGEKNYLEAIFPNPKFLTTCMYGTMFLVLGNLAGNSIAFAHYVLEAAGESYPSKASVVGIAIAVLSLSVAAHVCSRRGGIYLSHFFAIIKVCFLIAMIGLGFSNATGHVFKGGHGPYTKNFDMAFSSTRGRNWSSYVDSFFYVMYGYSGFQQPFYALAECKTPRKTFPWATQTAMAFSILLFLLLNAAYFCVVPQRDQFNHPTTDMATLFFSRLFGNGNDLARRAMAGMIAVSIFGNMLVMTFAACRVKQEIAKEGIWPFSWFFAADWTTPAAKLKQWWQNKATTNTLEKSPIPALGLHWLASVTLVVCTATYLDPMTAFSILVNVYSYVLRVGIGCIVAGALLYKKLSPSDQWNSYAEYIPWIGRKIPIPALVVFTVYAFMLFAAFVPPSSSSPFAYANSHVEWFIVPTIGQSAWLWGLFWFLGLFLVQVLRDKRLKVTRDPNPVLDPDDKTCSQWIMDSETVTYRWRGRSVLLDSTEMT